MPVDIILPFGWNDYYEYNQHITAIKQNLAAGLIFLPFFKDKKPQYLPDYDSETPKIHVRTLTLPI